MPEKSNPPICPMMGVTLRDPGDGYHPSVKWSSVRCKREGCALWTCRGCGLAHMTTLDAERLAKEATDD
jgi:hypothetical protein